MKTMGIEPKKAAVIARAFFIYIWLTRLAVLSVTDTYYSVYVLCAGAGFLCLLDNRRRFCDRRTQSGNVCATKAAAGVFSVAVVLANYELFTPLTVIQNVFDGACCLAGGFVAAEEILRWMMERLPFQTCGEDRKGTGWVFLFVFGSVSVIRLLYLFLAQYPGILTTDSHTTIGQIVGAVPYNNTMPYWHTITVKIFVEFGLAVFGNMNAAVALFHVAQFLFMSACFGYVVMTLYQMNIPGWFLASVYAVYAFQPYNIVYSVTLWKDIPFAGAGVLFVTSLYRLMKNIGKSKGLNYFVFLIGALGFSLWRTNGWYAFLVTVLVMTLLLRKEKKLLLLLMVAVLIFCWILINPVLDSLDVSETNLVEAFAVPMQQVARVIWEGRELTAKESYLLGEIFWLDKIPQLYDPHTVDPIKFETFRYDRVDHIRDNALEYLKLYFSLGLRYPGDYLKAWIEETKGYWNGGYFFWIYTLKMGENPYGIELMQGNNLVASLFAAMFRYLEKPVFMQPLVSIGLHVWALVSCTLVNAMKKREEFLLAIPMLVLVFGLWVGTPVYSEFRYAYPIILSIPVILASTLFAGDVPEKN